MRRAAILGFTLWLAGCTAPPTPAPEPHSAAFTEGERALLADDFEGAAGAFERARAAADVSDERAAECSYWIGVCRRKLGDPAGAKAAFSVAAISADPSLFARTRLQLGDLAFEGRDWLQAREAYSAAARDLAALTTEQLLHARRRGAQAAFRIGDWTDGQDRIERWGPSAEPESWSIVRRVAAGGQFACVIGPVTALEAERLIEQIGDGGREATAWAIGTRVWVVLRPFETWVAAAGEAQAWRARKLPAAALP